MGSCSSLQKKSNYYNKLVEEEAPKKHIENEIDKCNNEAFNANEMGKSLILNTEGIHKNKSNTSGLEKSNCYSEEEGEKEKAKAKELQVKNVEVEKGMDYDEQFLIDEDATSLISSEEEPENPESNDSSKILNVYNEQEREKELKIADVHNNKRNGYDELIDLNDYESDLSSNEEKEYTIKEKPNFVDFTKEIAKKYTNFKVTPEIKELLQYVQRYKLHQINLEAK